MIKFLCLLQTLVKEAEGNYMETTVIFRFFGNNKKPFIFVSNYSLIIMTEKQEKILFTALQLFGTEGYHAVATSKIAKQAGVSEALIFRHFENKEGLLNAIMDIAKEKAKVVFADVVMEPDPKEVIKKIIELPFQIPKEDYEMWRLTYSLKWQTNQYDTSKMDPIRMALRNAFEKLGYKNANAETELLLIFLDGMTTTMLLHEPENKEDILNTIKAKYNL